MPGRARAAAPQPKLPARSVVSAPTDHRESALRPCRHPTELGLTCPDVSMKVAQLPLGTAKAAGHTEDMRTIGLVLHPTRPVADSVATILAAVRDQPVRVL